MKKYLLATTAAGAAMALTAPAQAEGYLKIFGGMSFLDDQNMVIASSSSSGGSSVIASYTAVYYRYLNGLGYTTFGTYPNVTFSSTGPAASLATPGGWLPTGSMSVATNTTLGSSAGTVLGTFFGSMSMNAFSSVAGTFSSSTRADMSIDNGFVVGAAAGTQVNPCLSLELEVAYRKANADVVWSYRTFSAAATSFGYRTYNRGFFHVNGFGSTATTALATPTASTPVTGTITGGIGTTPTTTMATPTLSTPITATGVSDSNVLTTLSSSTVPASTLTSMPTTSSTVSFSGTGTMTASGTTTASYSGELSSFAIMANAVWDFAGNGDGNLHPYVGVGIGWANVDVDLGPVSVSDSGIAYQGFIGLGWDLTDNTRLNIEGRYFTVTQTEHLLFGRDLEVDYDVAEIIIGLQYNF